MHIGIDIGGTKTEVCLLSSDLRIIFRDRISTGREKTVSDFFESLSHLFDRLLKKHGISTHEIASIGVGLPGAIDPIQQKMTQGSVAFFKNVDLEKLFRENLVFNSAPFQGKIVFDNDANCFALAEARLGAGKKWMLDHSVAESQFCLLGITLGTGMGGGIIVNGQILKGARGGAGEIGHLSFEDSGIRCFCGKSDCAEQFFSGSGMERIFKEQDVFQLAQNGNLHAVEFLKIYRKKLAMFLAGLVNILDPHVIILGGGLSEQDAIYQDMSDHFSKYCFLTTRLPPVIRNELGGSAGVIGAALLPWGNE